MRTMFRGRGARIGLVILAIAIVALATDGCVPDGTPSGLTPTSLSGPRVLVIAPHPDDETLAAGGAISTALRGGAQVTVVLVTCGDGFIQAVRRQSHSANPTPAQMQAYGATRAAETRHAAAALGLPADKIVFLGFADASLKTLWTTAFDASTPVRCANGAAAVPYAFALHPRAPYTGTELLGELESVIERTRPTTVIYPDASDANRDHWATSAFVQSALLATGYHGRELSYLVHRPGFPAQTANGVDGAIAPPAALETSGTTWLSLALAPPTRATKQRAFASYRTQIAADGKVVREFVRANEIFAFEPVQTLGTTPTLVPVNGAGMAKVVTPGSAKVRAYRLDARAGSVTLTLKTAAPVSRDVTYVVRARTLAPGGAMSFWDVIVRDGKVTAQPASKRDVHASGSASVSAGSLSIELPRKLTDGARWLMVSVDTSNSGGTLLDHSPWRTVRIGR